MIHYLLYFKEISVALYCANIFNENITDIDDNITNLLEKDVTLCKLNPAANKCLYIFFFLHRLNYLKQNSTK